MVNDKLQNIWNAAMNPSKVLAACSLALFALAPLPGSFGGAARAQFLRPPADVPDAVYEQAQGVDAAGAQVRIDRLENQVRGLTGQIEQMQFQVKRLEDQLRKFQEDVDFRFNEQQKAAKPAPKAPAAPAPTPKRTELIENGAPALVAAEPAAPGAPRDLATMAPGANAAPPPQGSSQGVPQAPVPAAAPRITGLPAGPLEVAAEADPNVPPDLTSRPPAASQRLTGVDPTATASLQAQAQPQPGAAPRVIAAPPGAPGAPAATAPAQQLAALPQATPADDYDVATAALKDGQFDLAEQRFRSYLDQHPRDRLTPEATFYLGESFFRRARPREAAEQYLKVTVDFPRAARAPEALVKLGLSLEKLGAVEQACAAFGEVGRKYPAASSAVRASAARESKRVQC